MSLVFGGAGLVVVLVGFLIIGTLLQGNVQRVGTREFPYINAVELQAIVEDTSEEGNFVYFGRYDCPQCLLFQPTVQEVLSQMNGRMGHFELNESRRLENEEGSGEGLTVEQLLDIFDVNATPTIVYMVNGEIVDRLVGNNNNERLTEFFERNGGFN